MPGIRVLCVLILVGLIAALRVEPAHAAGNGTFQLETQGYYCSTGGTSCADQTNGPLPGLAYVDLYASGNGSAGGLTTVFLMCANYTYYSSDEVQETMSILSASTWNNWIIGLGYVPSYSTDTSSNVTSWADAFASGHNTADGNASGTGSLALRQNTDNTGIQSGTQNSGNFTVTIHGQIGTRLYNTDTQQWETGSTYSWAPGSITCRFNSANNMTYSPNSGDYGYHIPTL